VCASLQLDSGQLSNEEYTLSGKQIDIPRKSIIDTRLFDEPDLGGVMAKKVQRREWTAANLRDLKSLAKKKTPAGKIAKSLKRTEGATRQKAFSLGLSLDSRR
jgi:hypothetical protein